MKHVLVLGAGQSTQYLIHHLLHRSEERDWSVTVADRDVEAARRRVGGHPRGAAVAFDVNDGTLLTSLIGKADIVLNLLAPAFQHQVACACVEHGRHMISASYRSREIEELDAAAQRAGVLILNEMGLDPGIDHISAMPIINDVKKRGGVIESFISYGSGVPAPDSLSNPLKYVITWNARNVVMAAELGAQFLADGKIKIVPYSKVFRQVWPVEVDGIGAMEAYPNRDSLSYKELYGLGDAHTMIRGTLRWPGYSEIWSQIVALGLPNERLRIPRLAERSYREVLEMFLARSDAGADLEQRVAQSLGITATGKVMDTLRWLGLFSDEPTGSKGDTAAAMLIDLLCRKLALEPTKRDMVILMHELLVRWPNDGDRKEKIVSTMVEYGEPGGITGMSRTVGLPAALATEMVLAGELPLTGSHIPTIPALYKPILERLEAAGLKFTHRAEPVSA